LASFVGAILTIGHPLQSVTPHTFSKDAAGVVVAPARMRADDGFEYVTALIDVARADAIEKVDVGELAELSAGYRSDFDATPGVVPAGEPQAGERYDGVQRSIRINHVALLREGRARAGRGARLLTDELQLDSSGDQIDLSSIYLDQDRWEEHLHSMVGKDVSRVRAAHSGQRSDVQDRFAADHAAFHTQVCDEHEADRLKWEQHQAAGRADDEAFSARMRALHGKDLRS
jgi:hypothetical protein